MIWIKYILIQVLIWELTLKKNINDNLLNISHGIATLNENSDLTVDFQNK